MGYYTSRGRVTERTVEVPWVLGHLIGAPVLDIASCGAEYLRFLPPGSVGSDVRPLSEAYLRPDCHFARCSVTALPFADGAFSQVLLVSTLEHVGCASADYGTADAPDKVAAQAGALAECLRVLRPGVGTLLLTVPYGRAADLGWQLVHDAATLERVLGDARVLEATYYRAPGDGPYRECSPGELADVPYQYEPGGSRADGVACLVIARP
jgi:SAM-dependent methyltransferase